MTGGRILLPVDDSPTLRSSALYALEQAYQNGNDPYIHLVYLPTAGPAFQDPDAPVTAGKQLLDRVEEWLTDAAVDRDRPISIQVSIAGEDSQLYGPQQVADVLVDEIEEHHIDRIVLDPRYDVGFGQEMIDPIRQFILAKSDVTIDVASDAHPVERPRLPRRGDLVRGVAVFGVTFGFYLLLAGQLTAYEVITGVIAAGLVTVTLTSIALWQPPDVRYTPMRVARSVIYIPYLLAKIITSNITIARVILDPRLPIEPRMVRYRPAVYGPIPLTTLANSITLTPGTLSVRVVDQDILVHTLVESSRVDLISGRLERAVRFLFSGRSAMRIPRPDERGDAEVLASLELEEGE